MKHNLSLPLPGPVNRAWRVGIIHSSFYPEQVSAMVEGAKRVLLAAGLHPSSVRAYAVPGSFEIPLLGAVLAEAKEMDGLIGLGIIVEGETHHARLVAEQAARGIMDVQVRHHIPFGFEVLYVDDLALAQARLDAGEKAARCVLHCLAMMRQIQS